MASLFPTPARYSTIRSRQDDERWGADYVPSIKATVKEAPSVSRAFRLYWSDLGRDIHCISTPEKAAALLGLYNGSVFELHEQKMLSPAPRCHPLSGHPRAAGYPLPRLKGTVDAAERLGVFKLHPTVLLEVHPGKRVHVPFPWIGDLLLFLQDSNGPFCVNWNVKLKQGDHDKPFQPRRRASARSLAQAKARHEVEALYYQDAGIPTRDVSLEEIPPGLSGNLECLFGFTKGHICLPAPVQRDVIDLFIEDMQAGVPPLATQEYLASRWQITMDVSRKVLYRAIWYRLLRVDLYKAILIDKPLKPECSDVLEDFSRWFRR